MCLGGREGSGLRRQLNFTIEERNNFGGGRGRAEKGGVREEADGKNMVWAMSWGKMCC